MKHAARSGAPSFGLPLAIAVIAVSLLAGCAEVDRLSAGVTGSPAYRSTMQYHEGTPCSAFRYNDFGCE